MARQYGNKFQVKAVIEDSQDFDNVLGAKQVVEKDLGSLDFPWILTPCYKTTEEFPMQRFQKIVSWNHQNVF